MFRGASGEDKPTLRPTGSTMRTGNTSMTSAPATSGACRRASAAVCSIETTEIRWSSKAGHPACRPCRRDGPASCALAPSVHPAMATSATVAPTSELRFLPPAARSLTPMRRSPSQVLTLMRRGNGGNGSRAGVACLSSGTRPHSVGKLVNIRYRRSTSGRTRLTGRSWFLGDTGERCVEFVRSSR